MESIDLNPQVAYQKMKAAIEKHNREFKDIFEDLKEQLTPIREESFLIYAMRLILEIEHRATSSLYTHLGSPMKQTLYLIDVYYSIEIRTESVDMDNERWDKIATLLKDMEMTYFINIGFPNDGDLYHDERDEKVEVSLGTFLGYFSNAVLCYPEQIRDRIVRYFKPYDGYIQSHYGFVVDEAVKFILHIQRLNNMKLNDILQPFVTTHSFFKTSPEEWYKFIQRVGDPRECLDQPEFSDIKTALTINPGEIHIHETTELMDIGISPGSLQHILDFFSYDKDSMKGKTIYYADKRHSESYPLIKMGEKYVCPITKFLFEGLYFRLDEALMKEESTGKYKQNKGRAFEKQVVEVFRQFFPKETKFLTNYTIDGNAENDLLVIFESTCIIVEVKDCSFREPFRDPIKAYERIKSDFQKAIQYGYEQCRRVEKILLKNQDLDICDAEDKNKRLYHLRSRNISQVWSIVITDFRYGMIQTDLSKLLKKDEETLYPWSVCIDDLEALFLLMKKMLKGIAPTRFIEFLDYRERLQGHVICFDELEICGWYLTNREQFKEYADNEAIIAASPEMSEIFDAYYHVGLGFKDELDIEYKKKYKIQPYAKNFELNPVANRIKDDKHSL